MPVSRKGRTRMGVVALALIALVATILVVDYYFDTDILGATGRFLARFAL